MAAEKYAKFAYSTVFGYCVSRSFHCLEQAGTDSMLAFYVHGMYYVRRRCLEHRVTETEVYARWSPIEGIEVETWLIPAEGGHLRRHRIVSRLSCEAYDCGFSYPDCMEQTSQTEEEHMAAVWDENGESRLSASMGQGAVIRPFSNMNLIFPNVRIPAVHLAIEPGVTEFESMVTASFTQKDIVIGGGNCYALRD